MNRAYYLLLLLTLFISCSESENPTDPEIPEAVEQGGQSFSINNKEITAKKASDVAAKEFVPAYAFISIETSNGVEILDREKIDVIAQGEGYVTEEVMLDPGTYNLTEFILVDSDDIVVSLVPTATSALSQFSGTSLPFSFTVQPDDSKTTPIDNIGAEGYSWVEFGYDEAALTFPVAEDFFTLTVDDSELLTTKTIALKSLTGSTYMIDWGDGTVNEYISGLSDLEEENELTHEYEANGIYEIKITGAIEVIDYLNFSNYESEFNNQSNLVSAEIDKLTLLKEVDFHIGKLSSLDTSKNLLLEYLSLGYNQITSLDISNNEKLKKLYARYNQLPEINVSKNPDLEFLWVTGNQISSLDVSNNSMLEVLIARENGLTSIDLTKNPVLERIDLSDNSLSNINVSQNLNLHQINVGKNNLTGIDLTNNTEMVRIDLYGNQISSIDISNNPGVHSLYIEGNLISEMDLSNNVELEYLSIENNNLSDLELSNNTLISHLHIGLNQFTGEKLDEIISGVYNNAILNAINGGYIDFQNNPGTDLIDQTTISKINELALDYEWTFNNN